MAPLLAFLLLEDQLGPLLLQTGWVARAVLVILLGFSLFSWAIIFQKYRLFSQIHRQTLAFLRVFRANQHVAEPKSLLGRGPGFPLAAVYVAGFRELSGQLASTNPHTGKVRSYNAVGVAMQVAAAEEVRKLETWMPWLATTGSVSPFIGLFGTVWGVMGAFSGLGTAGAASLRAVAPGISEALVTTAAGLFAAVPAVVAYNHFLHMVKDLAAQMDMFSSEFVALVEKNYS